MSNNEMTITLSNRFEVKIEIAANGNFTIAWGDDTCEEFAGDGRFSKYFHEYPDYKERTIRITGDCVTGLRTDNYCNISSIDTSKNGALTVLNCSHNWLKSLDDLH